MKEIKTRSDWEYTASLSIGTVVQCGRVYDRLPRDHDNLFEIIIAKECYNVDVPGPMFKSFPKTYRVTYLRGGKLNTGTYFGDDVWFIISK